MNSINGRPENNMLLTSSLIDNKHPSTKPSSTNESTAISPALVASRRAKDVAETSPHSPVTVPVTKPGALPPPPGAGTVRRRPNVESLQDGVQHLETNSIFANCIFEAKLDPDVVAYCYLAGGAKHERLPTDFLRAVNKRGDEGVEELRHDPKFSTLFELLERGTIKVRQCKRGETLEQGAEAMKRVGGVRLTPDGIVFVASGSPGLTNGLLDDECKAQLLAGYHHTLIQERDSSFQRAPIKAIPFDEVVIHLMRAEFGSSFMGPLNHGYTIRIPRVGGLGTDIGAALSDPAAYDNGNVAEVMKSDWFVDKNGFFTRSRSTPALQMPSSSADRDEWFIREEWFGPKLASR
jgi:hypothetical protein